MSMFLLFTFFRSHLSNCSSYRNDMFFKENIYTKHARIEVKRITATMVKVKLGN